MAEKKLPDIIVNRASVDLSDSSKNKLPDMMNAEAIGASGSTPAATSPKRRFHRAAMQILSQVVQERLLGEDKPDSIVVTEDHRHTKTSSQASTKSETPQKKPAKRHSFASIARIYSLKRMSKLPGARSQGMGKNSLLNQSINEEGFELPVNPRFCATLSPEAQYAMMKCYDDILVENLKQSFPETKDLSPRVKTPLNSKVRLPEDTKDIKDPKKATPMNKAPKQHMDNLLPSTPLSQPNATIGKNKTAPPKETQLRITGRFERAMDILDTLRESEGQLVTSRRHKSKDIKPLRHYNAWSNGWTKEFKFDSKT